ncbi:MAG: hypothetical protein AABZ74_04035 [Cyanobacteriota bacterium]
MSLRKIALSTLSLVVVVAMSACSTSTMTPSVASVKATSDLTFASNIKPGTFDPVTNSTFIADIGNGKKGATINFTIKAPDSFKTQATNGTKPGRAADISTVNVTLKRGATPVAGATAVDVASTFTAGVKTFSFTNCTAGVYTVDINNVKDGAAFNMLVGGPITTSSTTVDANNQISGNATAAITLNNGTPATIDATVTATDGTTPAGAVVAS